MSKKKFHFVGVCGTAMGSVAVAMQERGYEVTGSDQNVYPPMSTFLADSGVAVSSGFSADHIPEDTDVVVIGNAMSRGNAEVEEVLNRKLLYVSLPEVLKEHFLRGKRNLVVSGTHGKTTTSAILAWLLESAGTNPSHMIGGIPTNLGKGARFTDSEFTVLEGDEYDTAFFDKRSKFLHYLPEVVVVNNIEFDHADIYDSIDEIKLTFQRLLNVVPSNGVAFVNGDDANCLEVAAKAPAPIQTVGFDASCDVCIEDVDYRGAWSSFTVYGEQFSIPMSGEFNVRNAAMAVCSARFVGLSSEQIQSGLEQFDGIARRQQLRGEEAGVKVVDDFAHHPTAIDLAIDALRQKYSPERLWVVFEPRSNTTRRNIFQKELAQALCRADRSVVAGVPNPEKVEEADRLSPEQLITDINERGGSGFFHANVDTIVEQVANEAQPGDVVAVLSNGGFDGIHDKLLAALSATAVASE
ncbi:UDP-N-acetylmuramate:L-alanyl-gamma-D-glutamyl-meso-diaminopimelate ligase [Rubritalea marina]|uniref:UDP-N-acetylmuramate:L-alanyl-gamma-D-glutamyl- meso-diaminopimelate ligase n=1 Tax=Rubritalea marina TaxID=361055 RepID=UPI0012EA3BD9|nr:UDP-N-acetylmuramate:L-alanyl-gamma-D-glutamyl-meso-diaminopimelate ligase [Rubritalea marina]